jgi:hypothetical protein
MIKYVLQIFMNFLILESLESHRAMHVGSGRMAWQGENSSQARRKGHKSRVSMIQPSGNVLIYLPSQTRKVRGSESKMIF